MANLFQSLKKGTLSLCNSILNGFQTKTTQVVTNLIQTRNLGYINRMMLKDIKRRETLRKYAADRVRLQTIKRNRILPKSVKEMADDILQKIPRDSMLGHVNDRCAITSRPASCLSRWRISRLVWRSLADYNQMSGVNRACWGVPTRNSACFVYKRNRPNWFNTEGYSKRKVILKGGEKRDVEFRFIN